MIRFLWRDLIGSLGARPLQLLAASLFLGVLLIAACTGLLALVRDGIASEERRLFGGDVELDVRDPLTQTELEWIDERGTVSRLLELRTMAGTEDGQFTVIELQSVDATYPLYGQVRFSPEMSLAQATADQGVAIDPALAADLELAIGDTISIGGTSTTVRAIIEEQPDRALSADVRGPPVLVSQETLDATGLITPTSLVDYEYRVRLESATGATAMTTSEFRDAWREQFPDAVAEVNTVEERNDRVTERLNEVASVLLLIAVATLLVGGLGVANGVAAWLDAKRGDLASLSAIGARGNWVARVVIAQVVLVALATSALAATIGTLIAWSISRRLGESLPMSTSLGDLVGPTVVATAFGTLAALAFAAPALGRCLATPPARLLRGDTDSDARAPLAGTARTASIALAIAAAIALVALVPDRIIGLGFVVAMIGLYYALSGIIALIRRAARATVHAGSLDGHFAARRAIAGLDQPGSALRPLLLSLGIASTLLVAAAVVIVSMLSLLGNTVPERAPALAFYDIQDYEVADFQQLVGNTEAIASVETVPLVLGRMISVNGESLLDRGDAAEALEANDEHKLSYRLAAIDNVRATSGAWWAEDYDGPPKVAMEDREAGQIGVQVGDTLVFSILGEQITAELAVIYAQGNFETRFWFEALFSPGVLDPFITRHVGVAWLTDEPGQTSADGADIAADIAAANAIADSFPTVVTIRTARGLETARRILGAAALAVGLVAATSLAASLLVLASVVAANRRRQLQEASILHAIGTRHGALMRALGIEYSLLGVVLALFATLVGGALGALVAVYWLELPVGLPALLTGPAVAFGIAAVCLGAGALWVARSLSASPARLLREMT
jgi:putative ABC transport system permease protein